MMHKAWWRIEEVTLFHEVIHQISRSHGLKNPWFGSNFTLLGRSPLSSPLDLPCLVKQFTFGETQPHDRLIACRVYTCIKCIHQFVCVGFCDIIDNVLPIYTPIRTDKQRRPQKVHIWWENIYVINNLFSFLPIFLIQYTLKPKAVYTKPLPVFVTYLLHFICFVCQENAFEWQNWTTR